MKKITSLLMLLFTVLGFSQDPTGKIQAYLYQNADKLNLSRYDINDWFIESTGTLEGANVDLYYIKQRYQGTDIYNSESVVAIQNDEVINFANNFVSSVNTKINTVRTSIELTAALQKGLSSVKIANISPEIIETISDKEFKLTNGALTDDPIRAKLAYFPTKGTLKLAWAFTFYSQDYNHLWSIKIDAVSGAVLEKNDLTTSCNFENKNHASATEFSFYKNMVKDESTSSLLQAQGGSYRVVPFNYESPNHHSRDLISNPENATASPKGWHDINTLSGNIATKKFTYLKGNNVWAKSDYTNKNGEVHSTDPTANGYSPTNAGLVFDFPYPGKSVEANTYIDAATTQLFYANNIFHDLWYQYGFNEANGNFQNTNYKTGGTGNDFVFADAQDSSLSNPPQNNNANFSTPPDGNNPRMQMYLWTYKPLYQLLTINPPSDIAGSVYSLDNSFNPGHVSVPVAPNKIETDLVLFDDGTPDVGQADNADACSPAVNAAAINGHIVVIRRSTAIENGGNPCTFVEKVKNAQNAGAIAVVVVNNETGLNALVGMAGSDSSITIPAISIGKGDGEAIIAKLKSNETVNGKIQSEVKLDLFVNTDGDMDNGVMAHEYMHGVSNRLVGGKTIADALQSPEQMGEGWSDWAALMLQIQPGDVGTTPRGMSTFCANQAPSGRGIRYFPYSTDMTVNPETFEWTNGTYFPTTVYDADGVEYVESHNVGEIWASMIWDLSWAYINKYGYDDNKYTGTGGNNKVMKLMLDAMKLTPVSPSFVQARDAIIAADQATTGGKDYCMIWQVFARRGLGVNASSGDASGNRYHVEAIKDQVEDFTEPAAGANCTMSVDYFENQELFRVYPNPTNGLLNVRINNYVGKVTMQVIDINGRVINEYNNEDFNIEKALDLNHLQTGVYVLKVNGDSLNFTQKIIKK